MSQGSIFPLVATWRKVAALRYTQGMYTTGHLTTLFNVSHQTIKNYCKEFAAYLSPTATPPANRQRQFTDDDLAVLSLVVELKTAGATFEDIHAALGAGQRGLTPDTAALTLNEPVMLIALRQQVTDLTLQISALQADNQKKDGKIELLTQMLADAQDTIRQLEREAGKRGS